MLLVCIAATALGVGLLPRLSAFIPPDFREGLVTPLRPLSLDPLLGGDTPAVRDVGHLLYRSLIRLDASAYPQLDLASGYTVDQSGTTYSFSLSRGSRWSDDRPITPADVVASFEFAQSHATTDPAIASAITGVHVAQHGGKVIFTLAVPRASFVATLSRLPILPLGKMSARQLAELPGEASSPLPTSGPYKVQSTDSTAVELISNPFASVKPVLGRFELRLYESFSDAAQAFARGDVDGLLTDSPAERGQLLAQPGARAHDMITFRFVDVIFNERVPGLDDPVVRHAIATAVDRRLLVQGALAGSGGVAQSDPISRGLAWVTPAAPRDQASIAAAGMALSADGWVMGQDGQRRRGGVTLAFTLVTPDSDPLPQVATEFAQQIQQVGIFLTVDVVPPQSFLSQHVEPHTFQLTLADWNGGPDPDVSAFWRSNATPPAGFYVSGGSADPFLDQALDMLATLATRAGRVSAAAAVSAQLADDAPAVFLYTPTMSFVTRGSLVVRVPPVGDSGDRYDDVASWRRG